MIRVLLADDEHLIRAALIELIGLESDVEVVADTGEGAQVLPLALRHRPDVALLDVNLSDTSGLQVAAELHEHLPSCRTLLLTSLSTASTVRAAVELRVSGYLMKDAAPDALAEGIRKVASGQRVIAPELMLAAWESRANPLTPRETEVLRLAAEGQTVSDIADTVRLSVGTVRNYLGNCLTKLGARSRLDAVRIARQAGWLPPADRSTPMLDMTQ
ncbi:response regulator transcription factor [Streptomyces sp. NPDC005483]|uniref:response regulator transcription factor n=1 Tax=Streptomyces sp. NPDC005483 TaxID=3154882 RepID=UPI0033A5FF4A